MPRANRYILPGHAHHLTHRCHDREFLLRFQKDRDTCRKWLREGKSRHGVSVLEHTDDVFEFPESVREQMEEE